MKIAYVVPRYGDEVVGGAEQAVRMLAERLAELPGTDVEVLTTRAVDARTWANEYPEGTTSLRGVLVHRFTATGRRTDFDAASAPMLSRPESLSPAEEQEFLRMQGPVSSALVDAVRASDADLVVGSPYLFDPVVAAMRAAPERAVLHPAAHDEAVLRLPLFRDVFATARGLVFYTHAEQQLVWNRFRAATTPQIVLGLGCDPLPGDEQGARTRLGVGDRPYVLCLGRVESSKGTDALARAFARYKDRHPGPLALVYVGPVANVPPSHPDIVVAGAVDDATKWGALRGAKALVSPSPYESFGLVVLEAWAAGTPVLVNGVSAATREHCERSGGGLWFRDYEELEVALARLDRSPDLGSGLALAGERYARTRFAWPSLTDRYLTFLRRLVP